MHSEDISAETPLLADINDASSVPELDVFSDMHGVLAVIKLRGAVLHTNKACNGQNLNRWRQPRHGFKSDHAQRTRHGVRRDPPLGETSLPVAGSLRLPRHY